MKYRKLHILAILLIVSNMITPAMAVDELPPASQAAVSEPVSASASVQNNVTTTSNGDTAKTVVVTATKTKKNIIEVPANVTVVTADEIKKNNYQNMKDILQIDDTSSVYFNYGRHVFPVNLTSNSLTRAQYDTNPAHNPIMCGYSWSDGNRYGTGYQKNLSENQNISFDSSYSTSNSILLTVRGTNPAQGFYQVSANKGTDVKLKYSHKNFIFNGGETTTGIDYTSTLSDYVTNPAPSGIINAASRTNDAVGTISLLGIYLQQEIPVTEKIKATVGGRYDSITFNSTDRLLNSTNAKTMGTVTPKATICYSINDNSSMYLSFGQAYTPPTATHLFTGGGTTGTNPNLTPELATNYEIGYKAV